MMMAAAVCLLCGCGGPSENEAFRRSVWLTQPVSQQTGAVTHLAGVVREAHEISLGFKTPGQIAQVWVKAGDRVRKGQLLAELDAADYRLAVEAAQIQYDQLRGEEARAARLLEQKSLARNDYEKLASGLKQLEVQLQAKKNQLDYTKLYAPTDGYVQQVNFTRAEMVDAGTPVFALLDVSHLEVSADLSVREYRNRTRFCGFYCRPAGSDERIPMKLLSITPKADGNQLYQLRLVFDGPADSRLSAGMNVAVEVESTETVPSQGVSIPLSALFEAGGERCVWVFDAADSVVHRRTVETVGVDADGRVRVVTGLSADEAVVRAGVHALQEGERVRVLQEAAETNVGGLL